MALPLEHVPTDPLIDRNFQALSAAANSPIPQAHVFNSTAFSAGTSGAVATVTFDTTRYDNGGLKTSTTKLSAPTTGLYAVGAQIMWGANATGNRWLQLRVNGANVVAFDLRMAVTTAATGTGQNVGVHTHLTAGDFVEVLVEQVSGGALSLVASNTTTVQYGAEFWMTRLAGFTNQL